MKEIEFQVGVIHPVKCLKEGWELIKPQYGTILLITFLGVIIGSVVPFGILIGAMYCGIYASLFKLMDHEQVEVSDLFIGFNYFGQALIAMLILVVPTFLLSAISTVPIFVMQVRLIADSNVSPNEIFAYSIFIALEMVILTLILGCLQAFLFFAFPLIVEHDLGGFDAFRLSARAVWNNLGGVVAFIALEFVLGLIGVLLCFVGIYLALPIMFSGALVVYRKVFPREKANIHSNDC